MDSHRRGCRWRVTERLHWTSSSKPWRANSCQDDEEIRPTCWSEWPKENRERHPKSYLAWLCRDPNAKKCNTYRETSKGATALADLDWRASLTVGQHCQYLRAMVKDIAEALGESFPGPTNAASAQLTSRYHLPEAPILRNL